MSKANHTVTVPREYLEELEKFREQNDTRKENIQGMLSVEIGFSKTLVLRENKITGDHNIRTVVIVDTDGRELMNFKRF